MEKITMLGTGHAMTFECFNTCFVYENENGKMLVDTGGGGQLLKQLRAAGVDSREIHHVFISHQHTDHLMGLPWLFRGPAGEQDMTLYLHEELMEVVQAMLGALFPEVMQDPAGHIRLVAVHHGEEMEILGRKVRFLDLHSPNVTQYGFAMELEGNRKLVFHGDVPFHESNRQEIRNADWLLHEAFHLESEGPGMPGGPGGPGMPPMGGPGGPGGPGMPPSGGPGKKGGMGHSTVRQAASYAQSLQVKNLVLFHSSDNDLSHRQEKYTAEARSVFEGNILVPYDLDVIEL